VLPGPCRRGVFGHSFVGGIDNCMGRDRENGSGNACFLSVRCLFSFSYTLRSLCPPLLPFFFFSSSFPCLILPFLPCFGSVLSYFCPEFFAPPYSSLWVFYPLAFCSRCFWIPYFVFFCLLRILRLSYVGIPFSISPLPFLRPPVSFFASSFPPLSLPLFFSFPSYLRPIRVVAFFVSSSLYLPSRSSSSFDLFSS